MMEMTPAASRVAPSGWRVRLGQGRPEEGIERFLEALRQQALLAEEQAFTLYERGCRELLAAAADPALSAGWQHACRDYAWRPLEELQRLCCGQCNKPGCRDRLLRLFRRLERLQQAA